MIWIILGSVLFVIVVALFVGLYMIYKIMYQSPHKGQNNELRAEPALDYQGMREKSKIIRFSRVFLLNLLLKQQLFSLIIRFHIIRQLKAK